MSEDKPKEEQVVWNGYKWVTWGEYFNPPQYPATQKQQMDQYKDLMADRKLLVPK